MVHTCNITLQLAMERLNYLVNNVQCADDTYSIHSFRACFHDEAIVQLKFQNFCPLPSRKLVFGSYVRMNTNAAGVVQLC